MALPQNSSELTTTGFIDHVLARFGIFAEMLTDYRKEFLRSFEELLTKAIIDYRRTSKDHPKVDGLAERVVQTIKHGLRKYKLLNFIMDLDDPGV